MRGLESFSSLHVRSQVSFAASKAEGSSKRFLGNSSSRSTLERRDVTREAVYDSTFGGITSTVSEDDLEEAERKPMSVIDANASTACGKNLWRSSGNMSLHAFCRFDK